MIHIENKEKYVLELEYYAVASLDVLMPSNNTKETIIDTIA